MSMEKHDANLAEAYDQLGLNRAYCNSSPSNLTMEKKWRMWNVGDFTLTDSNGTTLFTSEGKTMSPRSILDKNGDVLFYMSTTLFTRKTSVYRPTGEEVATVERPLASFRYKLATRFTDFSTHQEMLLQFVGGQSQDAQLTLGSRKIAEFRSKQFMATSRRIDVGANIDLSLIMIIAICFEILLKDHKAA